MLRKICLLVCFNQYASKAEFTIKLAEALNQHNIQTSIIPWPNGPVPDSVIEQIRSEQPDMTASFNQPGPLEDGKYFWDHLKMPHLTMLLDPAIYDTYLTTSPYSIISCVDRFDVQLLNSTGFENVFFLPHGCESDIIPGDDAQRIYDVTFLGTCYDPYNLRAWWKKHYPEEIGDVIDYAVELGFSDNKTTFRQAALQSMAMHGISPKDVNFVKICYFIDYYMRGIERIQLIRSIKDARVHIFGDQCWREETPIKSWSVYFASHPNVCVHPPVNYLESLEIQKKSKICLNSMPMFKNGSHERIFSSLACGALPVTNDNLYVRETFVDGEELVLFNHKHLDAINEKVKYYLKNEKMRKKVVSKGRDNVMKNHTWENRAAMMLQHLPNILDNIKTTKTTKRT